MSEGSGLCGVPVLPMGTGCRPGRPRTLARVSLRPTPSSRSAGALVVSVAGTIPYPIPEAASAQQWRDEQQLQGPPTCPPSRKVGHLWLSRTPTFPDGHHLCNTEGCKSRERKAPGAKGRADQCRGVPGRPSSPSRGLGPKSHHLSLPAR